MPSSKDFKEVINQLETVVDDLRDDRLSLDERVRKAGDATKKYRDFVTFFKDRAFDVRTVEFRGEQQTEKSFNWKDLD